MSDTTDDVDWYDGSNEYELEDLFYVLKNGVEICNNCGSKNIKLSAKGNKYCAELCWVAHPTTPNKNGE